MWETLGLSPPDFPELLKLAVRLGIASVLGAVIGLEREARGRHAGLRTHMLVALGCALFTLIPLQAEGAVGLGEITKGITAGIGFLGAGAILKRESDHHISGITTAAGIWTTAAMGFAVGAGYIGAALVTTAIAWLILCVLGGVDQIVKNDDAKSEETT
jgi:putative Mg2+ transporter-C (MgtC) family protein